MRARSERDPWVLATGNHGKIAEFRHLLAPMGVSLMSVTEALGHPMSVEETGATFEENACLKARAVAEATGLCALADDSGLEVLALGGRPGVRSARYAGEGATDQQNNDKLLEEMCAVEPNRRAARFRCVLAWLDPAQPSVFVIAQGQLEGMIAPKASGAHGFGYDPLFWIPELGRSLAELSMEEKNERSHRARALRELRSRLRERTGDAPFR